jgi:hypothetical protein
MTIYPIVGDRSSTSASHVEYQRPAYASHAGGMNLVPASHIRVQQLTSTSHVGELSTADASHVGGKHPTSVSHAGGKSPVTASHTSNRSLAYVSHVINQSPASAIHVGYVQPTTASHVVGIDYVEKPRWIGCKPKFPCKIFKVYHLTHLCPSIPEVQILWSMSSSPFDFESSEVPSQYIQTLVDEVVMPMQSSTDPTHHLGGDVHVDHVLSQLI